MSASILNNVSAVSAKCRHLSKTGTKESEEYLWSMPHVCLELTHNHGSETDDSFKVNNGNVEPHRGFGHIAVSCTDVYACSAELEKKGVQFQKKPDEGRMKGLAFALDPDGYWVEIVKRSEACATKKKYTFAQTMLRVKDITKSLRFYRDLLGMTLLHEKHINEAGFSLYFLATLPKGTGAIPAADTPESREYVASQFGPIVELTYNHGTETQADFKYHNGNDQDDGEC